MPRWQKIFLCALNECIFMLGLKKPKYLYYINPFKEYKMSPNNCRCSGENARVQFHIKPTAATSIFHPLNDNNIELMNIFSCSPKIYI